MSKPFSKQFDTHYTISEFGLLGTDKSVVNINKYESKQVTPEAYKEFEAFAKTDNGKDVLGFAGNGRCLQAKNYVGTIQTVGGYTLEILPKIYNDSNEDHSKQIFIKLLHLLYKLPSFKHIDKANFDLEKMDIFEIFISMFLIEVGQIIKKGIKSDYISSEENLFYLKGKLLINDQIKHNIVHKERFHVRYDDYSVNRAENKLLKTTLKYLSKLSKDFENLRLIRLYQEHMSLVNYSENIDADFRQVKKDRGMKHYQDALLWSKIFLKKESFSSFSGDTIAFAILYPMEKLFEGFVKWWLESHYKSLEIQTQSSKKGFVRGLFGVRPDFVIKKDQKIITIADAKWKIIEDDDSFSQSDFYQLFGYSKMFNVNSLRLYYPMNEKFKNAKTFQYFDSTKIKVIPLNLSLLLQN
ncbi:MAG: McrC family protein [Sulfuricurvum sp.]|uniref:McrC family protein n=1 Tax=Sulfuricurvum sp. TaxID=2025608 RepID=UPI002619EDA0|nr:McrC family protein [Sulfuricurvum sp.]MDD2829239.1 McrC family protein [Sulfuricurvum sp.]